MDGAVGGAVDGAVDGAVGGVVGGAMGGAGVEGLLIGVKSQFSSQFLILLS